MLMVTLILILRYERVKTVRIKLGINLISSIATEIKTEIF